MSARRSLLFWSVVLVQVALFNAAIVALRANWWPLAVLCFALLIGPNVWALRSMAQRR